MNFRLPIIACFMLITASQAGCLALNVPSQRHHDPSDGGGIFGHWSNSPNLAPPSVGCVAAHSETGHSADLGFVDEGMGVDPFDVQGDSQGKPKPPEIPWPRFHPIPTRPVFGPEQF